MNYNNFTSISIGDIEGIGIEIILKLWKKNKIKNFIVFTNIDIFNNYLKKNKIKISINLINHTLFSEKQELKNKFNIFSFKASNKIENVIYSLKYSYTYTKQFQLKGLLTLPLNKDKIIINKYKNFTGHTEYLEKIDKVKISNMIFIKNNIIFSTVTTHIKLKNVATKLNNKAFLFNKIKCLYKSLNKDFNIKNPKVIVSGLNPHAGENGKLGDEEINIIEPIINKLKKLDLKIHGPVSGDSMISRKKLKKYDCFLFMYHDQALIPFKFISQNSGVNYTSNLSIIRVSPDHGTAYDIVGKNKANTKSILNCFKVINLISKNRKKIAKT